MTTSSVAKHASKKIGPLVLLLLLFSTSAVFANTQAITSLYNTGQNNAHTALSAGTLDPHYVLQTNPYDGSADAFAVNTFSSWVPPTLANTSWITPCVVVNEACQDDHVRVHTGHYIYSLTFNLDAGFKGAIITGLWAADNNATMFINGVPVAHGGTTPSTGFETLTPFLIDGGSSLFHFAGSNELTFDVFQAPSTLGSHDPTGLLVQMKGIESTETTPEPSSLVLLGSGAFGLVGLLRRRRLG